MSYADFINERDERPRILYCACPLCDSTAFRLLATADCSRHPLYTPLIAATMRWMRCDACEHVFTDGYFDAEQSEALFGKSHGSQVAAPHDVMAFEAKRGIAANVVARVVRDVYRSSCDDGAWLDVGCGDGALALAAQESGFDVDAIDVRAETVAAVKALGVSAQQANIARLATRPAQRRSYSVVSMADVLEHEPFPKAALGHAASLLAPSGVLFVSCPNMDTALWRELTKLNANPYWGEIEHFHNFTRKRLYALLRECGFEPLSYAVSERYRMGMEVIARKSGTP